MNTNTSKRILVSASMAALLAALLLFAGCKDSPPDDEDGEKTVEVPASSLDDALDWLDTNAEDGNTYTITLKAASESIASRTLSYNGKNVSIILSGGSTERWVVLSTSRSLFTVEKGVSLTLDSNVTLQGRSGNNTSALVRVSGGGTLVMNTGSKIIGSGGGGVYVTGTFTSFYGGEVSVSGTFTMNGGEISGNNNNNTLSSYGGGGVYVEGGTFTMSGGKISENSSSSGGGVFVSSREGNFTLNGGMISGNSAAGGGGVYVAGTFTMSDGTISSNTSSSSYSGGGGGGVYVGGGTFTMSGGKISENSAAGGGGGVFVYSSGIFIKQRDGIIYGSNADGTSKNTTGNGNGHAVYVDGSPAKKRNTTAGAGISLNSGMSGTAGGWE
jgi:hypothetical protein